MILYGKKYKVECPRTYWGAIDDIEDPDKGDCSLNSALYHCNEVFRFLIFTTQGYSLMVLLTRGEITLFEPHGHQGSPAFFAHFNTIEEFVQKFVLTKFGKKIGMSLIHSTLSNLGN